ncbi:hypothetical protein [Candidatus Korarchaeum cryptofilum]|nr:hypothetical protein [Candidatus Korarchaeum cryptofilum]
MRKRSLGDRRVGRIREVITLTRKEFGERPIAVPVSLFLGCLDIK